MKTVTYEVPALYGDHHVVEVRRLLMEIPGVQDIYASSAFHLLEVSFDPEKTTEKVIEEKLTEGGYLGEIALPVEASAATYLESDRSESYFRHTEVFETTQKVVSFTQEVNYSGKPLWNCPGMGVIRTSMEE
jgi:hypothetical protein